MNTFDESVKTNQKLTNTSKKIADYFFKNHQAFLENDAKQLGELTNTSAASIVRFCKQLGFKGLNDFKIKLAQNAEKTEDKIDPLVESNDLPGEILKKLLINTRKNTENTGKLIDKKSLNKAVNILRKANKIFTAGVAASALPARDLYYKFIRANKDIFFSSDVHIMLEKIYTSTHNDVLVLFSYSGLTKEIILMAEEARKNKTAIIAVTRNHESPLTKLADVTIAMPTTEKLLRVGAIDSLFSEIFISSLLYLATINKELPNLEGEMRKTEELTNQLKVDPKEKR